MRASILHTGQPLVVHMQMGPFAADKPVVAPFFFQHAQVLCIVKRSTMLAVQNALHDQRV